MGQVWEGTSPRWAGAPPTKAQDAWESGRGQTLVQMGLKAHPSGAPAHFGLDPFPLQPMGPSEIGGPTRWTPGTLPVVPVQYR